MIVKIKLKLKSFVESSLIAFVFFRRLHCNLQSKLFLRELVKRINLITMTNEKIMEGLGNLFFKTVDLCEVFRKIQTLLFNLNY